MILRKLHFSTHNEQLHIEELYYCSLKMMFINTETRSSKNMCKKKQGSARQLVNKRTVINSIPFTVQHFQPILPSRNYKFSHKWTNIQLLPSASLLTKIHVYKWETIPTKCYITTDYLHICIITWIIRMISPAQVKIVRYSVCNS